MKLWEELEQRPEYGLLTPEDKVAVHDEWRSSILGSLAEEDPEAVDPVGVNRFVATERARSQALKTGKTFDPVTAEKDYLREVTDRTAAQKQAMKDYDELERAKFALRDAESAKNSAVYQDTFAGEGAKILNETIASKKQGIAQIESRFTPEMLRQVKEAREAEKGERPTAVLGSDLYTDPSLLLDKDRYRAAVAESGASPEAKAKAMAGFATKRKQFAEEALRTLRVAGESPIPGAQDFPTWEASQPEDVRRLAPEDKVLQYMREMEKRGDIRKLTSAIGTGLMQGGTDIASQGLGVAAMVANSAKLAERAAEVAEGAQTLEEVSKLEGDKQATGATTLGGAARLLPPMAATIAPAALTGGASLGVSAALAGAQTAGAQFPTTYTELRKQGMPEQDALNAARNSAIASGIVTAGLTAAFGKTGVEAALGAGAGGKELVKSRLVAAMKAVPKGAIAEIPEELLDEMASQVIEQRTIDPTKPVSQIIDEFAETAPDLAMQIALLGGAGGAVGGYRGSTTKPKAEEFPAAGEPPPLKPQDYENRAAGGQPIFDETGNVIGVAPPGATPEETTAYREDSIRKAAEEATKQGIPVEVEGVTIATIPEGSDMSPEDVLDFANSPEDMAMLARNGKIVLPEVVAPIGGVDPAITGEMDERLATSAALAPQTVEALKAAPAPEVQAETAEPIRAQEAEAAEAPVTETPEEVNEPPPVVDLGDTQLELVDSDEGFAQYEARDSEGVLAQFTYMRDVNGVWRPVPGTRLTIAPRARGKGIARRFIKAFADAVGAVGSTGTTQAENTSEDAQKMWKALEAEGATVETQKKGTLIGQNRAWVLRRKAATKAATKAAPAAETLGVTPPPAPALEAPEGAARNADMLRQAAARAAGTEQGPRIGFLQPSPAVTPETETPSSTANAAGGSQSVQTEPAEGSIPAVTEDIVSTSDIPSTPETPQGAVPTPATEGNAPKPKAAQTASGKKRGDKIADGENVQVLTEDDQSTPGMPTELTVLEVDGIADAKSNKVFARRRDMTPDEIAVAQDKIRQRNVLSKEMGMPQAEVPQPVTPQGAVPTPATEGQPMPGGSSEPEWTPTPGQPATANINGQKVVGTVGPSTGKGLVSFQYEWNGKTQKATVRPDRLSRPVASLTEPPRYEYTQEQNTRKMGKHFPTAPGVHANHDFRKSFASMAGDTSLSHIYRQIARVMSKMPAFANVDLHVVADGRRGYAGEYSHSKGRSAIAVNLRQVARGKVDALGTILHEALHHITLAKVRRPQGAREIEVVQALDTIRKRVVEYAKQQGLDKKLDYEIGTNEEFISAIFTRPDFQNFLASIPDSFAPGVSVGRFRSVLSEIFRRLAELVTGEMVAKGSTMEQAMTTVLALFETPHRTVDVGALQKLSAVQSLAGERAEMPQFMRDSLDAAKAMAAAGKTSEEIRAVTGWFPGKYDGKMRWEIPDEKAVLNENPEVVGLRKELEEATTHFEEVKAGGGGFSPAFNEAQLRMTNTQNKLRRAVSNGDTATLGERLDHPELFAAYPAAKNIRLLMEPMQSNYGGYFDPISNKIAINSSHSKEAQISSLLHEVQHWIQKQENFAEGGDLSQFLYSDDFKLSAEDQAVVEGIDSKIAELRKEEKELGEFFRNLPDSMKGAGKSEKESRRLNTISYEIRDLNDKRYAIIKPARNKMAMDKYQRAAGEIEARDVQARQNLTPEQRKAIEPYSSENIAKEDAIVMFGGKGPQESRGYRTPADMLAEAAEKAKGERAADKPQGLASMFNPQARRPATGERKLLDMPVRNTIADAYREAVRGSSTQMASLSSVYAQARLLQPGLTPEEFLAQVQEGYDNGTLLLEGAGSQQEAAQAGLSLPGTPVGTAVRMMPAPQGTPKSMAEEPDQRESDAILGVMMEDGRFEEGVKAYDKAKRATLGAPPQPSPNTSTPPRFTSPAQFAAAFEAAFLRGDYEYFLEALKQADRHIYVPEMKRYINASKLGDTDAAERLEWFRHAIAGTIPANVKPQAKAAPPPQATPVGAPVPPPPPTVTPPPKAGSSNRPMLTLNTPAMGLIAKMLGASIRINTLLRRARGRIKLSMADGSEIELSKHLFKNPVQAAKTLAHEIGHLFDFLPASGFTKTLAHKLAPLGDFRKVFGDDLADWFMDGGKKIKPSKITQLIKPELIALSKKWRGDFSPSDKYRGSGKELYADFISAILNDPMWTAKNAPYATLGFLNALEQKPEVDQAYQLVVSLVQGGSLYKALAEADKTKSTTALERLIAKSSALMRAKKTLNDATRGLYRSMFGKWLPTAIRDGGIWKSYWNRLKGIGTSKDYNWAQEEASQFAVRQITRFDNDLANTVGIPLKLAGIDPDYLQRLQTNNRIIHERRRVGKLIEEDPVKARALLKWMVDAGLLGKDVQAEVDSAADEDLYTLTAKVIGMMHANGDSFERALKAARRKGAPADAEKALYAFDVSGFMLNPKVLTMESAEADNADIEQTLGPDQFAELQRINEGYHDLVKRTMVDAYKLGLFRQSTWDDVIVPNLGVYVPFTPIKYFTGHVKGGLGPARVGTAHDLMAPHVVGTLKMHALIRRMQQQKQALLLLDFFNNTGLSKELEPVEDEDFDRIKAEELTKQSKHTISFVPYWDNGEYKWVKVNGTDAVTLMQNSDPDDLAALYKVLRSNTQMWRLNYTIFSIAFNVANTLRNIATPFVDIGPKAGYKAAKQLLSVFPQMAKWVWARIAGKDPASVVAASIAVEHALHKPGMPVSKELQEFYDRDILQPMPDVSSLRMSQEELARSVMGAMSSPEFLLQGVHKAAKDMRWYDNTLKQYWHSAVDVMSFIGSVSEAAPKIAAYQALKEKKDSKGKPAFTDAQATYLATLEGIPRPGVAGAHNAALEMVLMFFRVAVQSWRKHLIMATAPQTRAGFLMRHMLFEGAKFGLQAMAANGAIDYLIALGAAAAAGGDDDDAEEFKQVDWAEAMDRQSSYKLSHGGIGPLLGWVLPDGSVEPPWGHKSIPADWVPIMPRLPGTELSREADPLAYYVTSKTMAPTIAPVNDDVFWNDFAKSIIPSLNPTFEVASDAMSVLGPTPPRDSYRGREKVEQRIWDEGYVARIMGLGEHHLKSFGLGSSPYDTSLPGAWNVLKKPGMKTLFSTENMVGVRGEQRARHEDELTSSFAQNMVGEKFNTLKKTFNRLKSKATPRTKEEERIYDLLQPTMSKAFYGTEKREGKYDVLQSYARMRARGLEDTPGGKVLKAEAEQATKDLEKIADDLQKPLDLIRTHVLP